MLDLTQHLPQDDHWMDDYAARLGWDTVCHYYNRVFVRLLMMQPGEELHVAAAFGIGPYGEEAAYLAGDVGQRMFPVARRFLCDCCRGKMQE